MSSFSAWAGSDKVVLVLVLLPPWSKKVSLSLYFFNAERIRETWYQLPVTETGRKEVNNHQDSCLKYKIHTWLKKCPKMPEVSWPWCLLCKNKLHNLSARKSKFSLSNKRMSVCETKLLWKWWKALGICFYAFSIWVYISRWVILYGFSISVMQKEGYHAQLFKMSLI